LDSRKKGEKMRFKQNLKPNIIEKRFYNHKEQEKRNRRKKRKLAGDSRKSIVRYLQREPNYLKSTVNQWWYLHRKALTFKHITYC